MVCVCINYSPWILVLIGNFSLFYEIRQITGNLGECVQIGYVPFGMGGKNVKNTQQNQQGIPIAFQ